MENTPRTKIIHYKLKENSSFFGNGPCRIEYVPHLEEIEIGMTTLRMSLNP
jgi:hypothetical protein